jgi:TPR repeat protein
MMWRVVLAVLVALQVHLASAQETLSLEALRSRAEGGDLPAMRAMAEAHYLGRGGAAQDFAEAARWYRRLAARGEAAAQTTLGLMYARGWGLTPNLAEARRWWSLAAAQNDAGAQHNLGMVYLEGQGVARDPAQALHWFRQAARHGHVASQRLLGLMLFEGEGTARDPVAGLAWLMIAQQNGEVEAGQALQAIGSRASAEERAQAHARAQEWSQKPRAR